jgi:hypothetical protein
MSTGYDFLDELRDELATLPPVARRQTRTRPRWTIAACVGGLVAVGAAVVLARGGSNAVPPADAAAFLTQAADRALAEPVRPLRPGQFYYEKTRGSNVGTDAAGGSGTSEQWTSRRSGRVLWNGHPLTAFRAFPGHPLTTPFGNRALTYPELLALPNDPEHLASVIRRASQPPGPMGPVVAQFRTIDQLLSQSPWPIPAQLRASILRVAAAIPGLTIDHAAHDCAGRPAIAVTQVSRSYGGNRSSLAPMRAEMLFDPTTDAYLGDRATVVGNAHPFECVALLNAGVVNSITQRP